MIPKARGAFCFSLLTVCLLLAGCGGAVSPQSIGAALAGPCGAPLGYSYLGWSPDGGSISFTTWVGTQSAMITVMGPDGADQRRLTDGSREDFGPVWSPDGKMIAFVSISNQGADIYRIDADGRHLTRLTRGPGPDLSPAWSPGSGDRIAFLSGQGSGNLDLYLMDGDGSNQVQLTHDGDLGTAPAWSPDGRWIAFGTANQQSPGIYLIRPDGTGEHPLDIDLELSSLAWSPDGERLAYVSAGMGYYGISLVSVDGRDHADLTTARAIVSLPAWSPDGKAIYFDARQAGKADIYRIDLAGPGPIHQTALTGGPGENFNPAVSPDGRTVIFLSTRGGAAADIYRMDADGSNQARLTANPANQRCLKWPF